MAEPAKVELRTDGVMRSPTAKEYTAGHRMYGYVNSNLLWAMDMAAVGQPLQSTCRRSSSGSSDCGVDPSRSWRDEHVAVVVHRVVTQRLAEVGHALLVDDVDRGAGR